MANPEEYGFRFTADGKQFNKSLEEMKAQSKRFEDALSKATDPAQIIRLTRALSASQANMKSFTQQANAAAQGLKGIAPGAGQANNAMINLGRVAQDASFGFVGIANNLEPLFLSFQQLKKETGSAGSAFKALFGAIGGAGGIGLLIGAVQIFDAFTNGYGIFAGQAKKAAAAQKDFNDELKQAEANGAASGVKLQAFIDIAKNGDLPLAQRNKALKDANDILGNYGQKLTLANVATEAITKQTQLFTTALINQAVAAKFADKIADLTIKQRDASLSYAKAQGRLAIANKNVASLNRSIQQQERGGNEAVVIDRDNALKGLINTTTEYKTITQELKDATAGLNETTLKSTAAFGTLGERTKTAKTETNELKNEYAELETQLANGVISQQEYGKQAIALTLTQIGQGKNLDALKMKLTELQAVYGTFTYATATLSITTSQYNASLAQQKILENGLAVAATNRAAVASNMLIVGAQTLAQTQALSQAQQAQADIVGGLLAPSFQGLFQGLLEGENAFGAFFKQIKQLIVRLIAAALAALALQTILTALFPGAGGAKGASGFGKLFQQLGGFNIGGLIPGLATGGVVTGPTLAMIGEGNESEAVLPLSVLDNMMGGSGPAIVARFSGRQFLEFIQTAQRDQTRLNF